MLKLPTHSGFHDLFLKSQIPTFDDVLSTLNPKFSDWSLLIYLRVTTSSASLLDIYFKLETNGQLSTRLYVKRDDFNFPIIIFQYLGIPTAPAYGFNISQLILNARACRLHNAYYLRTD